jgi:hypothetical protein
MTVRRVMIEEDDKETERAAATTVTEEEARVLATLAAAVDHMMIGTDAFFSRFLVSVRGIKKRFFAFLLVQQHQPEQPVMMAWIWIFGKCLLPEDAHSLCAPACRTKANPQFVVDG